MKFFLSPKIYRVINNIAQITVIKSLKTILILKYLFAELSKKLKYFIYSNNDYIGDKFKVLDKSSLKSLLKIRKI